MALFKISKGLKANLPSTKTEGYCYYTTDDSLFYIDYKDASGNLQRKTLNAQDAETLTGASLATILNSSDIEIPTSKAVLDALAGKSDTNHTHDDRYYTETEVDAKLEESKVFIAIAGTTTYQEIVNARDAGRVVQAVNENGILHNLVLIVEGEGAAFTQTEGTIVFALFVTTNNQWQSVEIPLPNADEYYQKYQVEQLLANKSDKNHNHDDVYYTESEIDSKMEYIEGHILNENNPHNVTKTQIGIGKQSGGSDTISWNGDTTGLTSTMGGQFYRVSDATPGVNDLIGAVGTLTLTNGVQIGQFAVNEGNIQLMDEGIVFIMNADDGIPYIFIVYDKAVGANFEGIIFNESGTYFLYLDGEGYVSSLTVPNYDGFGAEFKIYKEYLPDDAYDAKGAADEALESAKSYTDDAISELGDTYYTEAEVDTKLSGKSDTSHTHDGRYYTESEIDSKISTINAAIDGKSDSGHSHSNYVPTGRTVNGKALSANITLSAGDVGALPASTEIPSALADLTADSTHRTVTDTEKATWNAKSNFSGNYNDLTNKPTIPSIAGLATTAYVDSAATTAANTVKNDLLNGAGTAYDTLKELGDLIDDNQDAIEALEAIASGKANASDLTSHTDNTTVHITSTERTNWNAAKTHADSAHAPSNAEPNQNAFSGIITNNGTLTASSPSSNLQITGGSGISTKVESGMIQINNDMISAINENTSRVSLYTKTNTSNGEKKWVHVATPSSVEAAQTKADEAYDLAETAQAKAESKVDSLSDLGITATATELNYVDGVTSAIQTQLDAKVDSVSGKGLSTNDYTTAEKNKLSGIAVGAEKNQNSFSRIMIGSIDVQATSPSDIVYFNSGTIKINADPTSKLITFGVNSASTKQEGIVQLTDSTSSTSITTAATPSSVKSAYDLADSAYTLAESKVDSLSDLGITATATELNYVDGVTSAIQTQLNAKVPTSRTVNGKALSSNITLSASDVSAYSKSEIDSMVFITVDDIDTICGATIQMASDSGVVF